MANDIKGLKEALDMLQRLKKTDAKRAVRKGTRAGAKAVLPTAKALAPKRTGALAAGLKVRSMPRSRKWIGTRVMLYVRGTPTFYAGFLEWGTKARYQKKTGKYVGMVKPVAYLKRAAEQMRQVASNAAIQTIIQEIESGK